MSAAHSLNLDEMVVAESRRRGRVLNVGGYVIRFLPSLARSGDTWLDEADKKSQQYSKKQKEEEEQAPSKQHRGKNTKNKQARGSPPEE